MSSPRPDPDDGDPTLEARVAHAVAPYADLLPAEDPEALRALTARFLATHPVAAPLVDRLRPRRPLPRAARSTGASPGAGRGRAAARAKAGAKGRGRGGAR